MDLLPNKSDAVLLPITNTRISASEWNQLVGSCMAFITAAGLTPDASDNEQFLNAFKKIASELELVGANTALSNLAGEGNARFDAKVSKTGDTMTGALTINKASDHIIAQDTVLDANTTPSSNLNGGYYSIRDKNGNLITRLYSSNTKDGYNISALQVWSGTSANTAASMGIRMKQDGTVAVAFCPTPTSDSASTHIATTAWVRAKAWSFPSTTYDEITVGASQATYTAKYDGWIFLEYNVNSTAVGFVTVVQNAHADQQVYLGSAYNSVYLFTPINAGNFSIVYGNVTFVHARLFRAERYV